MNVLEAFSHREEQLAAELEQAKTMDQAIAACMMALEQTACELAQQEQDEYVRQRQQAVMAAVRRAPQMLRAAAARGEMMLTTEPEKKTQDKLLRGAKAAGAFLLAALAVYELIGGHEMFALLQLAGGALLAWGGRPVSPAQPGIQARGIPCADGKALMRHLRELCRAADICVSDLALLEKDAGAARLSGTADDAMLDLLSGLMEARASGRDEMAMRSLDGAQQYLHMLGVEILFYDAQHAHLFDILPTMGEARTIRPAMVKDGQVIRRGVAAMKLERSMGA